MHLMTYPQNLLPHFFAIRLAMIWAWLFCEYNPAYTGASMLYPSEDSSFIY
jgi:hypothetical protein